MILADLNQVLLSGLMAQIASQKGIKLEEGLIRHMILNIIRTHLKNFREEYGEVVLCADNRKYWRKEYFPFYKAGRKKTREKSDLDWHLIFDMLAKFRNELRENFPYKVIDVEGAEADDIIAVLTMKYSATQKVMILSSDKDFAQLQKYPNVEQYSPILKKYIKEPLPLLQLKQLIIRGDKGDGIPNILSRDDCFVTATRQKAITEAKIIGWMNQEPKDFCNDLMLRNFSRNETLIDLTKIPDSLKESILHTYENAKGHSKQDFMNYMIANRLKNLLNVIDEF